MLILIFSFLLELFSESVRKRCLRNICVTRQFATDAHAGRQMVVSRTVAGFFQTF